MTDRAAAWRRRAEEATGSRPVGPRNPGGGVLDDIDALLAEEEGSDPPKGEADREPLL
ncbi:hypothetical protein ACQP04_07870 [Pseudonocardia halophobica]|uniref:hypothetical protein n=1 Tax=Pseudonocardia halophobica TaxID=29401 RepID=UPI003D8F5309